MMGDDRSVTTVAKNDASATIGTVATAEGRIEAVADRTPTKTMIGTAQRATIPTLHGALCATGVKPPAQAGAKAPATNHDSTTVPRAAATAVTGERNNATAVQVRSTTTIGIVLPVTTPISPSDSRATDAMRLALVVVPTKVDRKATATVETTTEAGGSNSVEVGATTIVAAAPTEVSGATVTGHRVADETIEAVAVPTEVNDVTEAGRTALVAMFDKTGAMGTGAAEVNATNETVTGGVADGDHNSNAPRVRGTAERVGSGRAMRTTVSPEISGTGRVGSVEAMTIDRGAAP